MNAQWANNIKDKVRKLQVKLYLSAKENKTRRFHALYDKIYREDILKRAWKDVKENAGSAGIDHETIEDIEIAGVDNTLQEIAQILKDGRYRPLAARRVEIPKANGKLRKLGIPVVRDRIVQAATKIVMEPIFEADFKSCSYGFRPKKSAHEALDEIKRAIEEKKGLLVFDADITSYFDTIVNSQNNLDFFLKLKMIDYKKIDMYFQNKISNPINILKLLE